MTFENITRCPHCGAEGGGLYWQTSSEGAFLAEHDGTRHECEEVEVAEEEALA